MNVMLDLETLGTDPGCVILSIGAVRFDGGGVYSKFYQTIDPKSAQLIGLSIDANTVIWWLQQEEAARQALSGSPGVNISSALLDFSQFFGHHSNCKIWGNGASFDNAILSAAYKAAGLIPPYRSRDERCYLTIKNLHKD